MQPLETVSPRTGGDSGTVIFTGHGRLPQSIGVIGSSPVVAVEIEVDLSSHRVVHVGAAGMMPLAVGLLRDLLQGGDLDSQVNAVLETFQRRYVGCCQRAICSAVANAYEGYLRYRQRSPAEAVLP